MSNVTPLPNLNSFPELIIALNERFRQIASGQGGADAPSLSGTHSDRAGLLAAQQALGTLFVEKDRGNALYQVQNKGGNTWEFVAAAGDAQLAYASMDLSPLTNSYADITGATLTLKLPGRYLITGCFTFQGGTSANDNNTYGQGQLMADSVAQSGLALFGPLVHVVTVAGTGVSPNPTTVTQSGRGTVAQQWLYTATAAGKIVKLRADKSSGSSGDSIVVSADTSLSAVWIGP